MSNWGDKYDDEAKEQKDVEVKFMISFKSMSRVIIRIDEETREWNEKKPKDSLIKIWANVMLIFFLLFALTYSVFAAATVVFFFFYGFVLVQLYGAWKRFQYSKFTYFVMNLVTIPALFVIASLLRGWIFKMIS